MQGIMRSFTDCEATNMKWLFWFSLLINYLPVIESMNKENVKSCLSQPNKVIWRKIGESAVLPCSLTSSCSAEGWQYEWFSVKENSLKLNLLDNPNKYRLEGASLQINSLHVNDSGIYHCAAVSYGEPAPGAQYVGPGTTLVVREKIKKMVRNIHLWLSFVLLSIYSLVIVILIVKKNGCRRTRKINKQNRSTKKKQFRDVLQEMYSRRNLERNKAADSKVTVRRNCTQEGTRSDLNTSTDDIYQNV